MAKRPKLQRLDRLELKKGSGDRPSPKSEKKARKLEIKIGDREHPLFSPMNERLELEHQQDDARKVAERHDRAVSLVAQLREAKKLEDARQREREWEAARQEELKKGEDFVAKFTRGAKLARIILRFVIAFAMIYVGLRGLFALVDLLRHPPTRGVNWKGLPVSFWGGIAFTTLAYALRWVRAKLASAEEVLWVSYARLTILGWSVLCMFLALAAFSAMLDVTRLQSGPVQFVLLYVTLLMCMARFFRS